MVRSVRVAGVDPLTRPRRYPIRTAATKRQGPRQGPVVRMSVVGDIMLGRGVADAAAAAGGDPSLALRPMQRRLAAADITVGNLENTLSRAGAPTQGGDSFAAPPAVVGGLRDAGFDVLGLANNHAGDFGDRALVETVRRLREGGLDTFGAGGNPARAWQPAVVERAGVRFGFLGFNAIGETPKVRRGQPGAVSLSMPPRTGPLNRAEVDRFLGAVRRLDDEVDVVVALPHWGTQYTNVPEPIQRRVAGRLVSAGVDLVVGGHPHWVQGTAMVDGRLVAHSLGNFVFDMDFMEETQKGLLLELTFWGDDLKGPTSCPTPWTRTLPRGCSRSPKASRRCDSCGLRQPRPGQSPGPGELTWVDHRRQVGFGVVRRVGGASEPSNSEPGLLERPVVAGGQLTSVGRDAFDPRKCDDAVLDLRRRQWSGANRDAAPDPYPVQRHHRPQPATLTGAHLSHVVLRAEVVHVVALATRLLTAERDEHARQPRIDHRRQPG